MSETFMKHPSTCEGRDEIKARTRANKALYALTFNRYHDGLALEEIDCILTTNGFNPDRAATGNINSVW